VQVPRYSTQPFPPYRFLPGVNPHPKENPQGHSYGQPETTVTPLNPHNWSHNETYLYGIDLYNNFYWWESHEAWESLWKESDDPITRDFLQGLIKISAAFLKWRSKTPRGVESHYLGAQKHFKPIIEKSPFYLGVDLKKHLDKLERCFKPVIGVPTEQWPDPAKNYPFLQCQIAENK
jgi:hypothetical protein